MFLFAKQSKRSEGERNRERNRPFPGSRSKWPPGLGLGPADARKLPFCPRLQGPGAGAGHWLRTVLGGTPTGVYMGCRHHITGLNPLRHKASPEMLRSSKLWIT